MPRPPVVRVAAILILLAGLASLFVLYGADVGQPDSPPFDEDALATNGAEIVNERIELGGVVVDVNPVVLEFEDRDGRIHRVVLENAPDAEEGEQLLVVGTVQPDGTVAVDREPTVVREPWEVRYMYAISVVGVLLVAGRIANGWRFRPRRLVFEPRDGPLFERVTRKRGDPDG